MNDPISTCCGEPPLGEIEHGICRGCRDHCEFEDAQPDENTVKECQCAALEYSDFLCVKTGGRSKERCVIQPDKDSVRAIRDVPLQDGDWAVECSNPGHFLRVHPSEFGKLANNPAYSFFRPQNDREHPTP